MYSHMSNYKALLSRQLHLEYLPQVLLAYYLTLNRAQGQTLKTAGMYLPRSVFSHGHLYVGYSRCGDPDEFFVYAGQDEFENLEHLLDKNKTYTRNVVYNEIF